MKITRRKLRRIIREVIGGHTVEPSTHVDHPDIPAGFILVSDSVSEDPVAYAPIFKTDGLDRPFLVRTTDTKWFIPHGLVKAVYPQVEDAFNWVDAKEDWRLLRTGSRGVVGNFTWQWVDEEPEIAPVV